MTLKNLKLTFKKKSSSTSEFGKNSSEIDGSLDSDETEATVPDDDYAKYYGYNTCDNDEQRRSWSPTSSNAEGDSSQHRQRRMPRRSSLKGCNSPRPARRHSLTFSNDVSVTTITPTQELAKKKSSLWFNEKDYEKMQKKVHMIAERAQEGEAHNYCTRGLESLIQRGSETRRYAAWDAVLDEQEYQKESGAEYYDEDALSQSYREACHESRAEATVRAKQDEQEVAEYLSETRRYCRRMSM